MSQLIKLKKSSQPGAVPLNTDLDWGEIAINYADGKLYFKDSVGVVRVFNADGNATTSSSGTFDEINLTGGTGSQGIIAWDPVAQTATVAMGNNVTQQLGEETYYPLVKNTTGTTITNGTAVSIAGASDTILIEPANAIIHQSQKLYLGLATEDIPNNGYGRVTYFGIVRDIDTSGYTLGDSLYVDPANSGQLTNIKPVEYHTIFVGTVYSVSTTGAILVRSFFEQDANDISYDNSTSLLSATSAQGAIDELQSTKADISLLSSNITLYATNVASDVSGYYKLLDTIEDPDYPVTPVDIPTGTITTTNQLLASLVAPAGLFIGNPGIITVPTVGNIAKTAGNSNSYAEFFFRIYKRSSIGVETLVSTSTTTGAVNPQTLNTYFQFATSALFSNGVWLDTDRVVIKFYGSLLAGAPQYNFQFGGANPVRTQIPVPISVVPSESASSIIVDTSAFNNILSSEDTNVLAALETLDVHNHDFEYLSLQGGSVTGDVTVTANIKANTIQATQANLLANTATTNIDFSQYSNYYVTMSTNTTFTVSGLASRVGASGNIILKQDATGGRLFTKSAEMKTPIGGAAIAQSTSPNSLSILSYYIVDSSTILINYIGNFA